MNTPPASTTPSSVNSLVTVTVTSSSGPANDSAETCRVEPNGIRPPTVSSTTREVTTSTSSTGICPSEWPVSGDSSGSVSRNAPCRARSVTASTARLKRTRTTERAWGSSSSYTRSALASSRRTGSGGGSPPPHDAASTTASAASPAPRTRCMPESLPRDAHR